MPEFFLKYLGKFRECPGFLLDELVMSPIWPPLGQEQAASFPASGIRQTTNTDIREERPLKTDSGALRLTIASVFV